MAGNPTDVFQVGPISQLDNQTANARSTNEGALVIQELGGKYWEWVRRGYVFNARFSSQVLATFAATLANAPTLFNPSTSGKIFVPMFFNTFPLTGNATITSASQTGIVLGYLTGCGAAPASGLPLATAGTAVTPGPLLAGSAITAIGQTYTTMTYTAPYLATFPTSQILDMGIGWWQDTGTLGATYGGIGQLSYDFHGIFAMKPGTAVVIMQTGSLPTMTFSTSLVYAELPIGAAVLP